jgi:hypothetical protein
MKIWIKKKEIERKILKNLFLYDVIIFLNYAASIYIQHNFFSSTDIKLIYTKLEIEKAFPT